jgi:hypothetical protein
MAAPAAVPSAPHRLICLPVLRTKVGDVPTFRASDTDTDLPIVSPIISWILIPKQSLHCFKMKIFKRYNRFIALKDTFFVKVLL